MATRRTGSALRQIRTLFSVGRVGDLADGQLLEWFTVQRAEAEVAFEELVARHGPMVLDVCRRVLRDPHEAEDAFQATFLVLVRRAGSVRDRDALGGWLHRVTLRVALRAKSEASRRGDVERQVVLSRPADSALDVVEQADLRSALHEELDRIPASYRAALVACYLEGLTHEEAARRLRWPVGTVRSRLARGRARLRDRLARRGLAPGLVLRALARPAELVPAGLRAATAHSMFSSIAGRSAAGTVSVAVAALAGKVVRSMNLRALRNFAAVTLTAGAVAGMLPFLTMKATRRAEAVADEPPRAAPNPAGSIAGVVRDAEGRPVSGATVVAGAFSQVPDPERTIYKQYAAESVPRSYVIGPEGRIVHQSMGYSPAQFRQLIDVVEKELDALAK